MAYPTGASGYGTPPQRDTSSTSASGAGAAGKGSSFGLLVAIAAVLGVLNFLLGFMPYAGVSASSVGLGGGSSETANFFKYSGAAAPLALLLLGGLLAGFSLLPRQDWRGAAAASAIAGFVALLFQSFTLPDGVDLKSGAYVVLVLGFIQAALALVAVLFDSGVLTSSAPKPKPTPQAGGYPSAYPGQPAAGQQNPYQQAGYPPSAYQQQAYAQPGQQPQQPYGQPVAPPYGQQPGYGVGYPQAPQAQQPGYPPTAQFPPQPQQQAQQPATPPSGQQHTGAATPTEAFSPQQTQQPQQGENQ